MSGDRAPLREIDWLSIFPWLRLTRTAAIAWGSKALLLSLLGMTLTTAGWRGIASAYARYWPDDRVVQRQAIVYENSETWRTPSADLAVTSQPSALSGLTATGAAVGQAMADLPAWYTRPFWQMFAADSRWPAFSMAALCSLWTLAVWAFCGGAISRLAAARLAQDRSLGLRRAGRYAIAKWLSYFSGPLLPLGGVALFVVLPALVVGWIARLNVGFAVAGALWVFGLLLALLGAVMLVVLLIGWPLMAAAVSSDASDSYDSVSRSFGYVTHRPFHLAFYVAVAALIGAVAWCFVTIMAELTIYLIAWSVSWGSGAARASEIYAASGLASAGAATEPTGSHLVTFWTMLLRTIVMAFGHSFWWTAATGIYLLLRRDTDGTPLDEVFPDGGEGLGS